MLKTSGKLGFWGYEIKGIKYIISSILFLLPLLFLLSCERITGVDGIQDNNVNNPILFACIDGNWTGVYLFSTDDLKVVDSLPTPAFPRDIEVSPDGYIWYTIYDIQLYEYELFAIDAKTKKILRRVKCKDPDMFFLRKKGIIITYPKRLQFWDAETFSLIHTDTIYARRVVSSPVSGTRIGIGKKEAGLIMKRK